MSFDLLNLPGQDWRFYVGFGNEIRIANDPIMFTPPATEHPDNPGQVPYRATAAFGPNRIAFVGEPVTLYGGWSFYRRRASAVNHRWAVFLDDSDVTADPTYVAVLVEPDTTQIYGTGNAEPAYCTLTFQQPGIYTVALTVGETYDTLSDHTGYRQVIVFPDRETAYTDVHGISSLSGSVDGGGWTMSLSLYGDLSFFLSLVEIRGYIPVVVALDVSYETALDTWENHRIGFQSHRNPVEILFNGYVKQGTIQINHDASVVTFQAQTPEMILQDMQSHTYGFFEHPKFGAGITFQDLVTHDIIRYMLQEKSNWIDWHDVGLYYMYSDPPEANIEFRDFTWSAGMYWANIRDIASNLYEKVYCDRFGRLYVVTDRTMWPRSTYVDYESRSEKQPRAHLGRHPDPIVGIATQRTPGSAVLVPTAITIHQKYTAVPAYVKIIASLSWWVEEWGADWPQGQPAMHSGAWIRDAGHYFSDQSRDQAWENLWKLAARLYFSSASRVVVEVQFATVMTYLRIGDLIVLTVSTDIHSFANAEFEVTSLAHAIQDGQWTTTIQLREMTIDNVPSVSIPPIPEAPQELPD